MRILFLCMAVALLSACIPVEDFGAYWKKGTVDPALLGTWIPIASPVQDADERKEARTVKVAEGKGVHVANHNGTYRIDSLDEDERRKKGYVSVSARSLAVGGYTFLMAVDREGLKKDQVVRSLIRYKLEGDVLQQYSLADGAASIFIRERYPNEKNIKMTSCKDKQSKCTFSFVSIGTLDGEALEILSEIPDTKEFWTDVGTFRRQSAPLK